MSILINHKITYDSVMKRHLRPRFPLLKGQGEILPLFHRSPASLKLPMMLLCKGTCASVAPPSKGRGAMPPSCTPVPASLSWRLREPIFDIGAMIRTSAHYVSLWFYVLKGTPTTWVMRRKSESRKAWWEAAA